MRVRTELVREPRVFICQLVTDILSSFRAATDRVTGGGVPQRTRLLCR